MSWMMVALIALAIVAGFCLLWFVGWVFMVVLVARRTQKFDREFSAQWDRMTR